MNIHLATSANLEVFRFAKWDGIVGLGFSMDESHGGKSVIDRLMKNKACPEK